MAEFVASGRIVEVVLAVTLLEALALLWPRRAASPALAGAGWQWIAALLALAGLTHLADLRQRLG